MFDQGEWLGLCIEETRVAVTAVPSTCRLERRNDWARPRAVCTNDGLHWHRFEDVGAVCVRMEAWGVQQLDFVDCVDGMV